MKQGARPTNLCAEYTNKGVIDEVRSWLRNCHDTHNQCGNLSWSSRNPSNLIQIQPGSEDLRLVETSSRKLVSYAALSYSWGVHLAQDENEKERIKAHRTTGDKVVGGIFKEGNIKQRRKSFPISGLPDTIRDVIKLTMNLRLNYIWIDAMCIAPNADWNDEASRMHEVYGNAYTTLAICSSEKTTDGLPSSRQAWQYKRDVCRLYSGQWLENLDMPLNEIRLHSPLFTRAWTIQEERLSPRMIYVCGQRMYWSCSQYQQTEMGRSSPHLLQEGPNAVDWLRHPQEFLATHRKADATGMHEQWLELVKAYSRRDLDHYSDRFPAFAGLAVRYLHLYEVEERVIKEEYLAGLWRQTFAQDLAWSVQVAQSPQRNLWSVAPRWSWASVPLCSDINTQHRIEPIENFKLLQEANLGQKGQSDKTLEVVKRGALVREVEVCGPVRRLLDERSVRKDWKTIASKNGNKDDYNVASYVSQFIHCRNLETGQIVVSKPNRQEIVCQLDYLFSEKGEDQWCTISDDELKTLYCLQIGRSSMLLLMKGLKAEEKKANDGKSISKYRRVGICNSISEFFFSSAVLETLILE